MVLASLSSQQLRLTAYELHKTGATDILSWREGGLTEPPVSEDFTRLWETFS